MDEWQVTLAVLQKYLTCERRYDFTYQYHIRILLHFESKALINFLHYLWRSLGKIVKNGKEEYLKPSGKFIPPWFDQIVDRNRAS